ncbi:hypothetical protein WICPIJ_005819 [Wickerhamomyces pijperi]|uniref:Uncharacterized protein n=1 Tax=Wickerhamomyces pijperi TaxID=599730 RepID=A0A9P8TLG3_WICPI|nr:hypothetical protein WICPIJ_005819 [Wickerhamomyces pijperi]
MTNKTFPTEIIDRIITNVSEYYTFRELYRIPELRSLVSDKIATLTIDHSNTFTGVNDFKHFFEGMNLFSMTKDIQYFIKAQNVDNYYMFRLSDESKDTINRLKQKSLIIIRCYDSRDLAYSQIQTYSTFIHEIVNPQSEDVVSFHFEIIKSPVGDEVKRNKFPDVARLLPSNSERDWYDAYSLEVQIPCVKLYDGYTDFSEGPNWRFCKRANCSACNFSVDLIYPNYTQPLDNDIGIKGVILRKIHSNIMQSIKSGKCSYLQSLDEEVERETAYAGFKQLCKMIEFTSESKALRNIAINTMVENSDTLLLHPVKELTQKSLIPKRYMIPEFRTKLLECTGTWMTFFLEFIEFCLSQSNDVVSCVRFNVQQTKETLENDIELHVNKCVSKSMPRLVKLLQGELNKEFRFWFSMFGLLLLLSICLFLLVDDNAMV